MVKIAIRNKFDFGKRLKSIRTKQGLTQTELGKTIGVSKRVILYYENETEYPPGHILIDLSKSLKISIDELLGVKNMPKLPTNGKIWKKLKDIEKMTPSQQKQIFDLMRLIKNQKK